MTPTIERKVMENEQQTTNETEDTNQAVTTEPIESENTAESTPAEVTEVAPEVETEREGFIPRERFDKVNTEKKTFQTQAEKSEDAFKQVAQSDFESNPKAAIEKYKGLGYDTKEWENHLEEQGRNERMDNSEFVHTKDIDAIVEQKFTARQNDAQNRTRLDNNIKEAEKLGVPAQKYLEMVRDHGLSPQQAHTLYNAENLKSEGAREEAERIESQGRGAIISNTKVATGSQPDFNSMSAVEMEKYLGDNGMGAGVR